MRIQPTLSAPTDRERVEVHIVKRLMESYLALVKKNVADSVPKAIMFFLAPSTHLKAFGWVLRGIWMAFSVIRMDFGRFLRRSHGFWTCSTASC